MKKNQNPDKNFLNFSSCELKLFTVNSGELKLFMEAKVLSCSWMEK